MKGLIVLIGLGFLLGSAGGAIAESKDVYPSKETIGLASEAYRDHSRAWISNIGADEFEKVAGTYQRKDGKVVSFGAVFQDGYEKDCFYSENAQGRLYSYRTTCTSWFNQGEQVRYVSINLKTGNQMVLRYDPRNSLQEIRRFLSLSDSLGI